MKTRLFFVFAFILFMLPSLNGNAQITINIRYTAENGNVRKYVEEMESSGIAAKIRAVKGCLGYDYFYPADDPNGLLLIDSWADQAALNRYHSSPAMQEAAALREKYGLGGRTVRMFTPVTAPNRRQETPEKQQ
ncbi:MAG: antibiotic biosynthesis monooxygenase [Bacteroidaceae bacterium]|nr:antibiotic biosynthesis monooxygenase [Bacteroidaceae bacterium]